MNRQRLLTIVLLAVGVLVGGYWFMQLRSSSEGEPSPSSRTRVASPTNVVQKPAATLGKGPVSTSKPPAAVSGATPKKKTGTNVMAAATATNVLTKVATTNLPASGIWQRIQQLPSNQAFFPALGLVLLGIILFLVALRSKHKTGQADTQAGTAAPLLTARAKPTRPVTSLNVLRVGADGGELWNFASRSKTFVLTREHRLSGQQMMPASVAKDWKELWQPRLNVAWLPRDNVFMRVTHLPASSYEEAVSMTEFQLEKLSPLPVNQIIWSVQILPHVEERMQTAVVFIAARSVVEDFLTKIEAQGFVPDRLEIQLLDELQATPRHRDGAWIYADGGNPAVVAWWYGGLLCNLGLLWLPEANPAASLRDQLLQMAWAGELEGWLAAPPEWHLVADEAVAAQWGTALREAVEKDVEIVPRKPVAELAALTATRAARTDSLASLLPSEHLIRYRQQFVDRLWMRGLAALVMLYLVGVGIYFVALQYALFRTRAVETQVAAMGPTYTNAVQLKARYEVLKDRQELKYAALDCWKLIAEFLPAEVTLDQLNFGDGKRLNLAGTSPADQVKDLYEFEAAIRKAEVNGQPMFDALRGDNLNYNTTGGNVSWRMNVELKRVEVQ
jgi:hypothetical protein